MESTNSKVFEVDILQPPTLWIQKRCYRILLPGSSSAISGNYIEDEEYPDTTYKDEMECALDFDIPFDKLPNGKIRTSFPVANSYFSYIIGAKGATKQRIENDTYTQIKIPYKGQVGDIVIIGKDLKTVRQARIKVDLLVEQARRRQPFTHFVGLPFNHSCIQENFNKFKREVLEQCGDDRGVDESLFQTPLKLHMTIAMLVLADDRERQEAVEALQGLRTQIMNDHIGGQPLRVEIKGVDYMNDDPGEVHVLYGNVATTSWTHSLQEMADDVLRKLGNAGVASKQYETVKLHMTLMNTRYRNEEEGADTESEKNKSTRYKERESFDAKGILKEFKDFSFGEIELSELHLSIRHTATSTGYYSASCTLPLTPESPEQ